MSTFVFPLTTIGNGLDGSIADLKVYDKALSPAAVKLTAEDKTVTEVNVAQDKAAGRNMHSIKAIRIMIMQNKKLSA